MQKDEIIINRFIKTIRESSINVTGNPVVLDRVFEALGKKEERKRFFAFFMLYMVVVSGLSVAIWVNYIGNNQQQADQNMVGLTKHYHKDLFTNLKASIIVNPATEIQPIKKITKPVIKEQQQNLTVSYTFHNHQVDVTQQGSEEFIQINVFGSDGSEIDVFKMMEDLKESYMNKEVYVDSANYQAPRKLYKTVRNPIVN